MITIYKYTYEAVVKKFSIYAPVKHGTRWLQRTHPDSTIMLDIQSVGSKKVSFETMIANDLFVDTNNPYGNSKLTIKKFKKQLKVENPVFVYRDPYDCFVKAILTASHITKHGAQSQWDGNPENLYIPMCNNGHFSPTLWQSMLDVLEFCDSSEITFIDVRELSKFITINTLQYIPYNFETYSFEKSIVGGYSIDELVDLCKEYHPVLWDNFMVQIEKEKMALDKLLEKFKWNGK